VGYPEDAVYCESALAAITEACVSIDVLLSSVSEDENPLLPALAEAASRGVAVRVLLDASDWEPQITARNEPARAYLVAHGVEARFDDPDVTLHAKLLIVDRACVVLGSSNWNRYALTEHWQADVLVRDARIGAFYADYFETLWNDAAGDVSVELKAWTPPEDEGIVLPLADLPESATYARVLLDLLGAAKRSIHVSMYRMSTYPGYADSLANAVSQALIDAAARGLEVQVLLDDCAYYADSASANLLSAFLLREDGVQVRLDAPEATTHAKLVIIDGRTVLLGSTNWNYYALERNYETDIAFINVPAIAETFENYFRQLWQLGRDVAS
jgi:phosphatidylserine/phosphatidylglycerophosphate/cardiolipin synthase-like enzyme